jgi:hypothetical protein
MPNAVHARTNVISSADIEYILGLPEVIAAKESIDAKSSGSVYFSVALTPGIKAAVKEELGLDLSALDAIPMRWIKGDTVPHIDTGAHAFDATYLMYLTDSAGEFVVDGASYPISRGAAYVFPEGLRHETARTGTEPRLLLGPMSEEGLAVGGVSISAPGGTTVYIRDVEGDIQFSADQETWNPVLWPCYITNTDTAAGTLKIVFATDIFLNSSSHYFTPYSAGSIQFGSESLREDGTRPIITINGITGYLGLINNGNASENGQNDIHVYNLDVRAAGDSTLAEGEETGAGWICQPYFGKGTSGNYIVNCTSNGPVVAFGGGIVGSNAADFGNLNIIGCSSSGALSAGAGGIVGSVAGSNNGNVTCESCWSTGIIGTGAGGIVGEASFSVTVRNCYSEGAIGQIAGGICGQNVSNSFIGDSYSRGSIGTQAGGIVGANATNTNIQNCYSLGNIASQGGGIAGLGFTPGSIYGCYTTGTVTGGTGYFIGESANIPSNCYSEAANGSSGWNSTNANTVLQGLPEPVIGEVWVASASNQPYELYNMGYSPYSVNNINITGSPFLSKRFLSYYAVGEEPEKDMANEIYTSEFDPFNYQSQFFAGMADFIDANIVAGDKDESNRLNASYWDDLGNDVFDKWGYFYIYDVSSGKYYFPLINPQNQDDGVIPTQTFSAFGRTFTIRHGWSARGIFMFDITADDNLPFRFGAYGDMDNGDNGTTRDLITTYTVGSQTKTLYYRCDGEDDDLYERLYSYFIPKNAADNASRPYDVYYDGDDTAMRTAEITRGITIYFAKSNDVKNWVVNELENPGTTASFGTPAGTSATPALISGKNYSMIQIADGDEASYGTITVDPVTGAIITTVNTVPGLYTLYIRNSGSYNYSTYILTVVEPLPPTGECCELPLRTPGFEYAIRNDIIVGNTMIGGIRREALTYSELMKMKLAYVSR